MRHATRLLVLLLLLLSAVPTYAQQTEKAGTITANGQSVVLPNGRRDGTAVIEISGTWTGTIAFHVFGATWGTVVPGCVGASGSVTSTTANGKFVCPSAGWSSVRAIATASITGTANVLIAYGPAGGGVASGGGGASGTVDVTAVGGNPVTTTLPVEVVSVGGETPITARCDDPDKVTFVHIALTAATGNTQLVALNGSDRIFVCSYVLMAGGADDTQFIYGTGSACATGETDIQSFEFEAAGDGAVENGGGAVVFTAPAGNALCVERTNSVTLKGRVSYVREP